MNKDLFELLILVAFEYGRNFEQLYLDLDLYNVVNFNDFLFAKEKGAALKFKDFDILNFENIFKFKVTTDIEKRKFNRLIEIKNNIKNLSEYLNSREI